LLYALFRGPAGVYVTSVAAFAVATVALARVHLQSAQRLQEVASLRAVLTGLHYIWTHKPILGSISLDLFAVLLGGSVALLPVYAREILHTGPWGLGLLRAAPGLGAATMAILLAYRPLRRRAGAIMLWCVAGFGVFTIVLNFTQPRAFTGRSGAARRTDMVSTWSAGLWCKSPRPTKYAAASMPWT
jgi:hypothetical protein